MTLHRRPLIAVLRRSVGSLAIERDMAAAEHTDQTLADLDVLRSKCQLAQTALASSEAFAALAQSFRIIWISSYRVKACHQAQRKSSTSLAEQRAKDEGSR